MSSWPAAISRLTSKLLGRTAAHDAPPQPGRQSVATGARAVVATEALASDRLCHLYSPVGTASRIAEKTPVREVVVNAFGKSIQESHLDRPATLLAHAQGLAMTGLRTAAFLSSDRLPGLSGQLAALAGRHVPMVLHAFCKATQRHATASGSGHDGYHAVADTGLFMAMARNAQEAADLALVARRTAELALVPGLIAQDGPETAFAAQDVRLPEDAIVRQYLHSAGENIDSPTPAQRMLFGETRRVVPRWFNLDRPLAHDANMTGQDFALGLRGQRVFFNEHLAGFARQAMDEYQRLTGRSLSFVSEYRTADAKFLIVAQGSAIELAEAAAQHARTAHGLKVGVIGLTWLRPFPIAELQKALGRAQVVTVLERVEEALANEPPLLREVRAALPQPTPVLVSAIAGVGGQSLSAAQLVAVCQNMAAQEPRRHVHLGLGASNVRSEFPKRDGFLQTVHGNYPQAAHGALPVGPAIDVRPKGARSAALFVSRTQTPESVLTRLARALVKPVGPYVRSRAVVAEQGCWIGRLTASPEPLLDPGDATSVEAVAIATTDLPSYLNPLADVVEGGVCLIATPLEAGRLWSRLPDSWRATVAARKLRLFVVRGDVDALVDATAAALAGKVETLDSLPWEMFPVVPERKAEVEPPLAVRRMKKQEMTCDNVPRFFGEVVQPRLEGEAPQSTPDPLIAVGTMPASTASFRDVSPSRATRPVFNMADCSGCGKCWTACPDSAIGPVAIGTEALLNALADRVSHPPPVMDKLRRAFRQLAARIDSQITQAKAKTLTPELCREAFDWLAEKLKLDEGERSGFELSREAIIDGLSALSFGINRTFFHLPHEKQKGTGELLALALNPQTCLACGLCAEVCADDAVEMVEQTSENLVAARAGWSFWEQLPDTTGATIARVSTLPEVGPLSAALMSRHCMLAVAGGEGAEPGSGERIALRQITAVVEQQMQGQTKHRVEQLTGLAEQLRERIHALMAETIQVTDLGALDKALSAGRGPNPNLGQVLNQLDALGQSARVDSRKIRRLARCNQEIENLLWRLTDGPLGIGRARFALVIGAETVADWALSFPYNPFYVPVMADLNNDGLAVGLLEGLLADWTDDYRTVRHAELALESPPDIELQEEALEKLTWRELPDEQLSAAPPVLLLSQPEKLGELAQHLADSRLPLRIVLFDGMEKLAEAKNPALLALGQHNTFVLSAAISHHDHLHAGIKDALRTPSPTVIHVHAPSPHRHGFATDATMTQARRAVESRLHPLLRYDPAAKGVFGSRLSLEGNPSLEKAGATDAESVAVNAAQWALGEGRYETQFSEVAATDDASRLVDFEKWLNLDAAGRLEKLPTVTNTQGRRFVVAPELARALSVRQQSWTILQEIAGVVSPFTTILRARIETELKSAHQAEQDALANSYEQKLAALQQEQREIQATQLRQRLMQLSGYAAMAAPPPTGNGMGA